MGLTEEGTHLDQFANCDLSDRLWRPHDRRDDDVFRKVVGTVLLKLTTPLFIRHGPAVVDRIHIEVSIAAKALSTREIWKESSGILILTRLDNFLAVDRTDQLNADVADFPDYSWKNAFQQSIHDRVSSTCG